MSNKSVEYEKLRDETFALLSNPDVSKEEKEAAIKNLAERYMRLDPSDAQHVRPMIRK